MTSRLKCKAVTRKGSACKLPVWKNTGYCYVHRDHALKDGENIEANPWEKLQGWWDATIHRYWPLGILIALIALVAFLAQLYNAVTGKPALGLIGRASDPISNSPSVNFDDRLDSSPRANAYISLLSADPPADTLLAGADDIPYSYAVKYYVPTFDWARLGVKPVLRIFVDRDPSEYGGHWQTMINSEEARVGQEAEVVLKGRMKVPNDRDSWDVTIQLSFEDLGTQTSHTLAAHTIRLNYAISRSDFEPAFVELIAAQPEPKSSLRAGEDVTFLFEIRYLVPEFEVERMTFTPFLKIGKIGATDEYGHRTVTWSPTTHEVTTGVVVSTTISQTLQVPSDGDELRLELNLVTDLDRTPKEQATVITYSIEP